MGFEPNIPSDAPQVFHEFAELDLMDNYDEELEDLIEYLAENTGGVPEGLISMWSGSIDEIPDGWALCDGDNGTPDLTDSFVVGAGSDYSVNETGGEEEVTLSQSEMPSHSHNVSGNTNSTGSHSHSVSGTFSHQGSGEETNIQNI